MTGNEKHQEHFDAFASKIGMWIFIFTELLLFGGLFIVYSVLRFNNQKINKQIMIKTEVIMAKSNFLFILAFVINLGD